jgi:two-component system, cell cycle sensor histidine kinase and response regulator CckA
MSATILPRRAVDLVLFGGAALVSAALLLWAIGDPIFASLFFAGLLGTGGLLWLVGGRNVGQSEAPAVGESPDLALLRSVLDSASDSRALAVTDKDGRLLCAN